MFLFLKYSDSDVDLQPLFVPYCLLISHVSLFCMYNYRHTLACSVWLSTPTRTCPSIQRTSLRCTEGRRGTRCLHTSMPSLSQHTAACFKVRQTVVFSQTDLLSCSLLSFLVFIERIMKISSVTMIVHSVNFHVS